MRVVKGTGVTFTATFYDVAGAVVVPAAATCRIAYTLSKSARVTTISLTNAGGTWTGVWNAACDPGTVYYSIKSNSSDLAVFDGSFVVEANRANG
jgi:hypothetical protein